VQVVVASLEIQDRHSWGRMRKKRKVLRSVLSCDIIQLIVVNPYRRTGTTYRSRNVGKILRLYACITSLKSANVIYFAVEASNHVEKVLIRTVHRWTGF